MTTRHFNKLCRLLFGERKKNESEPNTEERHQMLMFVVRHRGPVHPKLITPLLDMDWLHSMGYLYTNQKGFLCLCEHLGNVSRA